MSADFSVHHEPIADHGRIVAITGEIDLYTSTEFKACLRNIIDAGTSTVIVDLAATTFLDSTGLGVLIGALKRLRAIDGRLAIVNVDAHIARTFSITGLDQILTICSTRAAAIDALTVPAST